MASPKNQAAWLDKANTPLEVREAPLPIPGPGELVVQNAAVAMNGVDNWMLEAGVFVNQWPTVLGSDISGTVYAVGPDVERFKKGDRVIGHSEVLVKGRPEDGAFALFTVVLADHAAILPDSITFTDGVVLPIALGAASSALFLDKPGQVMPGVPTPLLGLPYPKLHSQVLPKDRTLVVYGGSSAVGSLTTQLATATGVNVIAISGAHNFALSQHCGASQTFDYKDPSIVEKVTAAVAELKTDFIGIVDAIATPTTYPVNLSILEALGGGHLICTHPPPANVPTNVKASMLYSVNSASIPLFKEYITPALETGKLECLPQPVIVGKGLKYIQEALEKLAKGVSAAKVVVDLQ